ncbi:MAG: hypothetical protein HQL69_16200 [Magnetococcales bacterium]|nr:hypothetical protein [Magnetococcales bacterium]
MNKIKFGIFAKPGKVATELLKNINSLAPGRGQIFPISQIELRLSIDNNGLFCDGVDLTTLESVWIEGFSYQNPVIPPIETNQDWTLWQIDHIVEQQSYSALYSLFQELDRRGVAVYNPPWAHVRSFARFSLMERIRNSGFNVPPLICSNHKESIDAFCQQHGAVVWRPASGLSSWQRFTSKQQADLVGVEHPPIMVAKIFPGPLNSSYLFEGKSLLSLQYQAPDATPPMEKLEQFWRVPCDQVPNPERLCQAIGGNWLKVSYITGDQEVSIYDVETDPLLSGLPNVFCSHLLSMLAHEITGQSGSYQETDGLDSYQERSNMFLRRMYRILFNMEASKYS